MKLIKRISSVALASLMLVSVFDFKSNAMPTNIYSGATRVEVGMATARKVPSSHLVIVSANAFADALSAHNIVSRTGGKIIMVYDTTDISAFLQEQRPSKITLIGGPLSLKGKPVSQAYKYTKNVERIEGSDRYAVNENTLKAGGFTRVGIADGRNFSDALSASGLLAYQELGLMLVDGSKDYNMRGREAVYTFGGPLSVKYAKGFRLGGGNRYTASVNINYEMGLPDKDAVSVGNVFSDAISSINFVTLNKGQKVATLIVDQSQNNFTKEQRDYAMKAKEAYVVGGRVSQGIIDELRGVVKPATPTIVQANNPTGVTAARLNQFLKGPCTGKGQLIIDLSNKYKQDPAFMVAIMGVETGYGANIRHTNNPMSVLWNYGKGLSTYPTIDAGIEAGIRNIATNRAYNNCTNLSSFCRVYLGYNNADYVSRLNNKYYNITGQSAYNVKVRI